MDRTGTGTGQGHETGRQGGRARMAWDTCIFLLCCSLCMLLPILHSSSPFSPPLLPNTEISVTDSGCACLCMQAWRQNKLLCFLPPHTPLPTTRIRFCRLLLLLFPSLCAYPLLQLTPTYHLPFHHFLPLPAPGTHFSLRRLRSSSSLAGHHTCRRPAWRARATPSRDEKAGLWR